MLCSHPNAYDALHYLKHPRKFSILVSPNLKIKYLTPLQAWSKPECETFAKSSDKIGKEHIAVGICGLAKQIDFKVLVHLGDGLLQTFLSLTL